MKGIGIMAVGSHKDAFKAHQLVKKMLKKAPSSILAKIAADILLDFVKNQRQVTSDSTLVELPVESVEYDQAQLDKALVAVDGLCGKCEDAHDDSCFVNQARRVLIAAKTGVDIGSEFDGETTLDDLMRAAAEKAEIVKGGENTVLADEDQENLINDSGCSEDDREELETLREKDVFRGTLIDEVVDTIQSVTEGNYAREMPVHEDEQLGKLAKAFNFMLGTIKKSMSDLDSLVAERTAELKQIMNTVPSGLLTLDKEGRIKPEHSFEAANILNHEVLRGRDFLDLLGFTKRQQDKRGQLEDYFDIIRMGMLSKEDLQPLNPFPEFELQNNNETKWVSASYFTVKRHEEPTGEILVILKDITEEKKLAAEVDASHKENLQLKMIAEDPDVFKEFLGEVLAIEKNVADKLADIDSANWKDYINEIFRGVHTIKGAAGSFGLADLAEASGELENELSNMRKSVDFNPEAVDNILSGFEKLQVQIKNSRETANNVLGEEFNTGGPSVRIPLDELKEIEKMLDNTSDLVNVQHRLQQLQKTPAHRALSRSVKIVPDLIKRLEKSIEFVFKGKEELINFEKGHVLNTALVHLLRNAFDHGIESTEEREKAGKAERAHVILEVKVNEEDTVVSLTDDGKGIDADKVAASAVHKGIVSIADVDAMSHSEKLELIFKPGFSTATVVTDISGRGVGLDAVYAVIKKELGGDISIESEINRGTSFILRIPE